MKEIKIIDLLTVDPYSSTSKYLQIANAVLKQIEKGNIKAGDNMPSINELSNLDNGLFLLDIIDNEGSVLFSSRITKE